MRFLLYKLVMCDIPRNIKYYNESIHSELDSVANEIMLESGMNSQLIHQIETSKDDSPEGFTVSILDTISAADTLIKESLRNNSSEIRDGLIFNKGHLVNHLAKIEDGVIRLVVSKPLGDWLTKITNDRINKIDKRLKYYERIYKSTKSNM